MICIDEICGGLCNPAQDVFKVKVFGDFLIQLVQNRKARCAFFRLYEKFGILDSGTDIAGD